MQKIDKYYCSSLTHTSSWAMVYATMVTITLKQLVICCGFSLWMLYPPIPIQRGETLCLYHEFNIVSFTPHSSPPLNCHVLTLVLSHMVDVVRSCELLYGSLIEAFAGLLSETLNEVVICHPRRLHKWIHNRWTNKLKPSLHEVFAYTLRLRCLWWNLRVISVYLCNWLVTNKSPKVFVEGAELFHNLRKNCKTYFLG